MMTVWMTIVNSHFVVDVSDSSSTAKRGAEHSEH